MASLSARKKPVLFPRFSEYDGDLKNFEAMVLRRCRLQAIKAAWTTMRLNLVCDIRVRLPAILLHGGLGHSGNWGYQVPNAG